MSGDKRGERGLKTSQRNLLGPASVGKHSYPPFSMVLFQVGRGSWEQDFIFSTDKGNCISVSRLSGYHHLGSRQSSVKSVNWSLCFLHWSANTEVAGAVWQKKKDLLSSLLSAFGLKGIIDLCATWKLTQTYLTSTMLTMYLGSEYYGVWRFSKIISLLFCHLYEGHIQLHNNSLRFCQDQFTFVRCSSLQTKAINNGTAPVFNLFKCYDL